MSFPFPPPCFCRYVHPYVILNALNNTRVHAQNIFASHDDIVQRAYMRCKLCVTALTIRE
jgi:hypothetical protein